MLNDIDGMPAPDWFWSELLLDDWAKLLPPEAESPPLLDEVPPGLPAPGEPDVDDP